MILTSVRSWSKYLITWFIEFSGNKCDSEDRVVGRDDGERLAREYRVNFMETSAKTGLNVESAFIEVAR